MDKQTRNRQFYVDDAISQAYYSTNPTFPTEVLDAILPYLSAGIKEKNPQQQCFNTAVDIACGAGLSTLPLAKHFCKVIGCDVSETQIKEARRHNHLDNVEYHVSAAEEMAFIPDGSVDLVTCATAIRYMDLDQVCREVKRILCTSGVFAIYDYYVPVLSNSEAQLAFTEVCFNH